MNILGSLEVGKIADIVSVDGNPLVDITVMEKCFCSKMAFLRI